MNLCREAALHAELRAESGVWIVLEWKDYGAKKYFMGTDSLQTILVLTFSGIAVLKSVLPIEDLIFQKQCIDGADYVFETLHEKRNDTQKLASVAQKALVSQLTL